MADKRDEVIALREAAAVFIRTFDPHNVANGVTVSVGPLTDSTGTTKSWDLVLVRRK